jgi:cation diffusion facilitator family transporter
LLAAAKITAGLVGHSQAVVADGVHSLTDMATDIAILVGVRYWSVPADEDHPYGHQRIETLVTVGIGLALASVAVGMALHAIDLLRGGHEGTPGWIALAAALLSMTSKEALYRWTAAVGRRIHSPALIANAWHHRSDAFSSLPAALAVGFSLASPKWSFLDAVGAVVVCIFILQASWRILRPAASELADRAAPPPVRERLSSIAASVPGVLEVHDLRTRFSGSFLEIDLHVRVRGDLSVREGHEIAESVRRVLFEDGPRVKGVVVHLDPD